MIYILILLAYGGNSMTSAEFSSKAACESALQQAKKLDVSGMIGGSGISGFCAPKSLVGNAPAQ